MEDYSNTRDGEFTFTPKRKYDSSDESGKASMKYGACFKKRCFLLTKAQNSPLRHSPPMVPRGNEKIWQIINEE